MPTYRDYFADIKKRIKEATPEQVQDLLRSGDVQLGDVREKNEWDEGHLPGAVHLPKSYLEQWAEDRLPEKNKTTILYCAGGVRSAMAAETLQQLGYTNVISMQGGFNRWKDSGKAWTKPATFTSDQAQRYFQLNHDMDFVDELGDRKKSMQDGRSDVIRQIAVKPYAPSRGNRREVGFQDVSGDNGQILNFLGELIEPSDQRGIEFNSVKRFEGPTISTPHAKRSGVKVRPTRVAYPP